MDILPTTHVWISLHNCILRLSVKMDIEQTPANNAPSLDPSYRWEFDGTLAKASSQGSLFSLYLAMHQSALANTIQLTPPKNDATNSKRDDLAFLNHYRKPALAASDGDWKCLDTLSQLMCSDITAARLFQSMNPSPLAKTDNPRRIPEDVINNCSLGTQKRLAEKYVSDIEEDNTLLFEVIQNQKVNSPSMNASI